MLYFTIINFVFAVLLIVLFVKHLRLKKVSTETIEDLQQKFEEEVREVDVAETQLREGLRADSKKIGSLEKEIEELKREREFLLKEATEVRKEKEEEMRLRLETEKQIVLALQKTEDVQKRMHDWKEAQDAAMKDSQDAIARVGEDLYAKLSASHKQEVEANKDLIEKVTEFLKKTSASVVAKSETVVAAAPAIATEKAPTTKSSSAPASATSDSTSAKASEDISKKLTSDLLKLMKESGYLEGEKYFLSSSFDSAAAKMFFCEAAFLQETKLYIFDFKACNFLQEYSKAADKVAAKSLLTQKLDKYIAYLGNPKYREAILKALATTATKFDKNETAIILPAKRDLEVLKEIGYYEKLTKVATAVMAFDEIIDLTL